ncbi:hypothetical protein JCM8097_005368 [Rhodosporidiobolus ruineniae]
MFHPHPVEYPNASPCLDSHARFVRVVHPVLLVNLPYSSAAAKAISSFSLAFSLVRLVLVQHRSAGEPTNLPRPDGSSQTTSTCRQRSIASSMLCLPPSRK